MKNNPFEKQMVSVPTEELMHFLDPKALYQKDAIEAAKWELERRGINSDTMEHQDTPETTREYDQDEININDFPQKPAIAEQKQLFNKSILGLILFIGAYYIIFIKDITFIFILAGVLLIHELGHFIAMKKFKYNDLGIYFIPLIGAYAKGSKEKISQKQQVIILLAGPLPGVIIGLMLLITSFINQNEFIYRTSILFLILNLFNLFPILPLDGGQILKTLFLRKNELVSKVFIVISAIALSIIAISTDSYFLLIISILLLGQLNNLNQTNKVKKALESKSLTINKSFSELTDREYWLIREEIGKHIRSFQQIIPGRYVVLDFEQRIIQQIKLILQKEPESDLRVSGKVFIVVLWILLFILPIFIFESTIIDFIIRN